MGYDFSFDKKSYYSTAPHYAFQEKAPARFIDKGSRFIAICWLRGLDLVIMYPPPIRIPLNPDKRKLPRNQNRRKPFHLRFFKRENPIEQRKDPILFGSSQSVECGNVVKGTRLYSSASPDDLIRDWITVEPTQALEQIFKFVSSPEIQSLLKELEEIPAAFRHDYVSLVLLDENELAKRNVFVPSDLVIQRSAFADKRPSLFCVTKRLPQGILWDKVTVTYDNPQS